MTGLLGYGDPLLAALAVVLMVVHSFRGAKGHGSAFGWFVAAFFWGLISLWVLVATQWDTSCKPCVNGRQPMNGNTVSLNLLHITVSIGILLCCWPRRGTVLSDGSALEAARARRRKGP